MRGSRTHVWGAAAAVLALGVSACAPSSSDGGSDDEGVSAAEVGVITSETWPLAAYGEAFLNGFEAGLDHATDGTGNVDGVTIEVRNGDDAGDPDKAVQLAKEYIGDGVKVLTGPVSSGVSLSLAKQAEQNKVLYVSGAASADAITGLSDYTFRSGRQSIQDVATAARSSTRWRARRCWSSPRTTPSARATPRRSTRSSASPVRVRRCSPSLSPRTSRSSPRSPSRSSPRPRPRLRRVGRRDHREHVAGPGSAGGPRRRTRGHRPRRHCVVRRLRLGDREDQPHEVASLVAWLCSADAGMVTGASYTMDGGWTAR